MRYVKLLHLLHMQPICVASSKVRLERTTRILYVRSLLS
jgi:hypothetical protein